MEEKTEKRGFSSVRPRRLRGIRLLREMVAGTRLAARDFVWPVFVRLGQGIRTPIGSMPGVFQYSPEVAVEELRRAADEGIGAFLLFGITDADKKDATGSHSHDENNAVCTTLRAVKDAKLPLVAITDLCYCEYTSHGHCGRLRGDQSGVDNDETVAALGHQAALHARCGADVVAPSAAMDHMVAAIRTALDAGAYEDTAILSYAVKYASAFYGPFREAAESPPQFGDRKGYQMDFRRGEAEALREAALDVAEGADLVMVKPGVAYLDILRAVSEASPVPTAVYQVSGEYAMLKAAAANGWIDERQVVEETMHAFKRAGAAFVVTYYARELARWVR
ncbi:MAG TPA: porphobilinogen synthase [Phycisphaerae bacterium]|nr:porphobilinogen synthase [Phycisphaerae bacterium]